MDSKLMEEIDRKMMTIIRCVISIRNAQIKKYGIIRGQLPFLIRISETPGINQERLAYMLRMDKTTVAKVLRKLEEKKFIIKVRSQEDNRKWLLYSAERLISIYDELINLIESSNKVLFKDFTDEEAETLYHLLNRIGQNVDEDWNSIIKNTNL